MSVKWDANIKGPNGVSPVSEPHTSAKQVSENKPAPPTAMEKPAAMALPDAAPTHPLRQAPTGKAQLLRKEIAKLREALRSQGANRQAAAKQALALAASFRMRRSRAARRMALELCEEVAQSSEELEGLASQLGVVLSAEGDLHEVSAEATLRACAALAKLLDSEEEE